MRSPEQDIRPASSKLGACVIGYQIHERVGHSIHDIADEPNKTGPVRSYTNDVC